ncbi:MAG: VanZ family protein [bacterium]|nr:VanZ family protein [bacterium]
MFEPLSKTIQEVVNFTWPMILISVVVLVSLRVSYFIKYRKEKKFVFYKELLMLSFVIYIMCLFQVVTFQDDTWSANNFIPFREIMRYNVGSRLFFKNVMGNIIMFLPYGFFASYLLKNKKISVAFILTVIASFSIELVQMMIGRVFDVDDIILNVCGGCLGFLIYYLIDKLWYKLPKVLRRESVLNIFSVIILVLVVLVIIGI